METTELRFIRRALEAQGFTILRTRRGFWTIRDSNGLLVTFLVPEAELVDWHNALLNMKERGLLVWPPEW